ncbi:putative RNA-binding Zn-ribbon protein involved in translation (DUF1610 family) [Clostridiales Family XIII bacterium PM5-7]
MEDKMTWIFYKVEGNMGYYAICPECGFEYGCSSVDTSNGKFSVEITKVYNYCPVCGENYYDNSKTVKVEELDRFPRNEKALEELGVKSLDYRIKMLERAKKEKEKIKEEETIYCSRDLCVLHEYDRGCADCESVNGGKGKWKYWNY